MPNFIWVNDKTVVNLDMVTCAKITGESDSRKVVLHLHGAVPEASRIMLDGDEAVNLIEYLELHGKTIGPIEYPSIPGPVVAFRQTEAAEAVDIAVVEVDSVR